MWWARKLLPARTSTRGQDVREARSSAGERASSRGGLPASTATTRGFPRWGALIARLAQQGVALGHRGRHRDHRAVVAARVLAQQLEGRAVVEVVALHEDALGALDERATLQRPLEALDLLAKGLMVAPAPHRHLDGGLDRVGRLLARVGEDAALSRLGDEVRVL